MNPHTHTHTRSKNIGPPKSRTFEKMACSAQLTNKIGPKLSQNIQTNNGYIMHVAEMHVFKYVTFNHVYWEARSVYVLTSLFN